VQDPVFSPRKTWSGSEDSFQKWGGNSGILKDVAVESF